MKIWQFKNIHSVNIEIVKASHNKMVLEISHTYLFTHSDLNTGVNGFY